MAMSPHTLFQLVPQRINARLSRLREEIWADRTELTVEGSNVLETFADVSAAGELDFRPVSPGETFGPNGGGWAQRWFRFRMPAAGPAAGRARTLFWECQGESTVYIDGEPWAGLDIAHPYCGLPDDADTVYIDCGTYQTGIWQVGCPIDPRFPLRFSGAHLAVRNEETWKRYYDLEVLFLLLNELFRQQGYEPAGRQGYAPPLEDVTPAVRYLVQGLDAVCDAFDRGDGDGAASRMQTLYRDLPAGGYSGIVSLVGHAHIDLVWLWPEAVTYRKGVHTFATALRLLERYPEYRFSQSSPLLYRNVERLAPGLMQGIREKITAKRWEVMGDSELEPDVNLPSGEALARSLYFGQRSVIEYTGSPSESLWLPDVFGYPNCLPQMLRLAGIRYFFTTKLTWSAVTRFPYSSFHWRSPDGTAVLTHLSALGYNEPTDPGVMNRAVNRSFQTGTFPEVLLPMGYGDGGGGTTEEMLERARRMKNLASTPKVQWSTGREFFDRLAGTAEQLPTYEGELYLEYHRGTYTTQSEMKRLYRRAERTLLEHDALRPLVGLPPLSREDWDRVLLAQFHDAIPGSSISLVYRQIEPQLDAVATDNAASIRNELAQWTAPSSSNATVFNPLPLERTVTVELSADDPAVAPYLAAGGLSQEPASTSDGDTVLVQLSVPGYGAYPVGGPRESDTATPTVEAADWKVDPTTLDNGLVRVEFGAEGLPERMFVRERQLLLTGTRFELYPDVPANFDAWDIDRAALSLGMPVTGPIDLAVVERGPLRASLEGRCVVGEASTMTVRFSLTAASRYLEVSCGIDWREDQKLLKFHAETGYTGRFARFGSPYGSVLRSQVPGLPDDEAQWEVPAQRWAAVMDDAVMEGFAIVTESKYGFSVRDGDIGVSLLRAPRHPDPTADRRSHTIRFALGEYVPISIPGILSTPAEAESRYGSLFIVPGAPQPDSCRVVVEDAGSLVPSGVRAAESGDYHLVLRFHETAGRRGTARLSIPGANRACYSDILEEPGAPIVPGESEEKGLFPVSFEPYRIVTVLVGF